MGFCLGVFVNAVSYMTRPLALLSLLVLLSQVAYVGVVAFLLRRKGIVAYAGSFRLPYSLILFSLLFIIGIIRVDLVGEKVRLLCDTACTFRAEVMQSPTKDGVSQHVVLQPVGDARTMLVQATVPLYPEYAVGDVLDVTGKVYVPNTIYPHDGKRGFDYLSYLGVHNVGSVVYFPNIHVVEHTTDSMQTTLGKLKMRFVAVLRLHIGGTEASLASGMLFGSTNFDKETLSVFRHAGLSHIVVLSGFNIAIVISSFLLVLRFLPLFVRVFVAFLGVFAFVLMVGAEASVLRATIMSSFALVAMLVGRGYVAKQALLMSLFIIVMYSPLSLVFDASLHLSFLATVGIVWGDQMVRSLFARMRSQVFVDVLTTSLCAYIATLPYTLAVFGGVSVYALLANILAVPLVGVCMLLAFMVVVASFVWPTLALLVAYVAKIVLLYIVWVAEFVTRLPFAYLEVSVSYSAMCLLYAGVFLFALWLRRKVGHEKSVQVAEIPQNQEDSQILRGVISY